MLNLKNSMSRDRSKMNILAAYDWIVVEPEVKEKTSGGIFLPETLSKKTVVGKVISVGIGNIEEIVEEDGESKPLFVSPIFEVGDRVAFIEDWAFPMEIDGKSYAVIKAENVFVKLEE